MTKSNVEKLQELLIEFKGQHGVDELAVVAVLHDVSEWLEELQELRNEKIRADYE